jgi:uncharacterized protein (DUF433 family)
VLRVILQWGYNGHVVVCGEILLCEEANMTLLFEAEPIPLETTVDGQVRVRGTRVTLDTIVAVFNEGATAEEIVQRYPTLCLADVYAIIAFYLRRRPEVEAYLQERRDEAEIVRQQNMARYGQHQIRERLLARRIEPAAMDHATVSR